MFDVWISYNLLRIQDTTEIVGADNTVSTLPAVLLADQVD